MSLGGIEAYCTVAAAVADSPCPKEVSLRAPGYQGRGPSFLERVVDWT